METFKEIKGIPHLTKPDGSLQVFANKTQAAKAADKHNAIVRQSPTSRKFLVVKEHELPHWKQD